MDKRLAAAAAFMALLIAVPAGAMSDPGTVLAQTVPLPMVKGEVTRVNQDTGKITIRHGPIPNLDMPNMTMVFALKDPGMIERLKPGAKITFTADRISGAYTVMELHAIE